MFFNIENAVTYKQKYTDFYKFCEDRYSEMVKSETGGRLVLLTALQVDEYTRRVVEEALEKYFILKDESDVQEDRV